MIEQGNDIISSGYQDGLQKIVAQRATGVAVVSTTDTTLVQLLSITPDDNTAGLVMIWCVAYGGGSNAAGVKSAQYKKLAGTLTLSSSSDEIIMAGDNNEAFSVESSGGSIVVNVSATGNVKWAADFKILSVLNESLS